MLSPPTYTIDGICIIKGPTISRLESNKRRNQILDIALELFLRQGYDGTPARQIAEAAKISKANLYHHFPSKDDLLYEMTRPLLDGLERILDDSPSLSDGICERSRILAQYLDLCLHYQELSVFVNGNLLLYEHPLIGSRLSKIRESMLSLLADASAGIEERLRAVGSLAVLDSAVRNFHDHDTTAVRACALRSAKELLYADPATKG